MASTGPIIKIAFAPEGQAPGLRPSLGAKANYKDPSWDAWTTVGKIQAGDVADLDEDSIDSTPREESIDIDPPLSQNREDEILHKNGIDQVTFSIYSAGLEVMSLSSTSQIGEDEGQEGVDIAFKAMVVEIAGVGFDYYPRVRVKIAGAPGGIKSLRKYNFICKVFGTVQVPSGLKFLRHNG